ncbi:MAG: galactokinase [Planctomycetes bacterium]|nr:galactokinase [Planctomycetota bacterium]
MSESVVAAHAGIRPPQRRSDFSVITPGRVNLIGEHTDYNEGLVLPMAIEPSIRLDIASRPDRWMILETDWGVEPEVRVDLGQPLSPHDFKGSWAAYPCGVVAGLMRLGWEIPGFTARISATLPAGVGLSSSAALEVGVATAVEALTGRHLSPDEKVLLCQRAEHEFAGVPCGIMDQYAVTFGKPGHALLLDCRSRELRYVPLAAEAVSVLVIHSGVKHSLADGEYAKRRAECDSAARLLEVSSLREIGLSEWRVREPSLPDLERRRSWHVVTEHERTLAFVDALKARNWQAAGECMYGSHASLRDDYEVSCEELDLIVDMSRHVDGVFGCRMTGGGFGGCAVALVDAARTTQIQQLIRSRYRDHTGIDPVTFVTKAAGGVSLLP